MMHACSEPGSQAMRRGRFYAMAAVLLAVLSNSGTAAADPRSDETSTWPQWRGLLRNGSSPGRDWPESLSPDSLTETWSVRLLGPSYSSPVTDAERVYTTETVDEEREVVRALSRSTGEEVWRTSWPGAMEVPFFAARNGSWIRSTPAVDAERLYVAGIRDVVHCLDVYTGEKLWSVDFAQRFDTTLPPFGCVSSPLVTDTFVYMQAGSSLVKLDKLTGDTIWSSMRDSGGTQSAGAFSSPVLAKLDGKLQVIAQSRTDLAGIEPETGRVLWSTPVRAFRGMNILTPLVVGDSVFTSAYGGRSHLFTIGLDEGRWTVTEGWSNGSEGYMTSPVAVDGFVYLFLRSNRFGCFDLESGETQWISRPTGDSYWSLAVRGDLILGLSDSGTLRLVRADPEAFEIVSERKLLDMDTWAHVAPAGNQLFIRAQESLVAYDWR